MAATVEVISDLYKAGTTEDGEDYIAEVFLVMIELDSGRRYVHTNTFPGCNIHRSFGCDLFFEDIRVQASAKAERLARRVRLALGTPGVKLNMAYWEEIAGVYGSATNTGMKDCEFALHEDK